MAIRTHKKRKHTSRRKTRKSNKRFRRTRSKRQRTRRRGGAGISRGALQGKSILQNLPRPQPVSTPSSVAAKKAADREKFHARRQFWDDRERKFGAADIKRGVTPLVVKRAAVSNYDTDSDTELGVVDEITRRKLQEQDIAYDRIMATAVAKEEQQSRLRSSTVRGQRSSIVDEESDDSEEKKNDGDDEYEHLSSSGNETNDDSSLATSDSGKETSGSDSDGSDSDGSYLGGKRKTRKAKKNKTRKRRKSKRVRKHKN